MAQREERDTYLVVGCGQFGLKAVHALKKLSSNPRVLAVDADRERLKEVEATADRIVHEDGVKFLSRLTEPQTSLWWIVPSLPLHLASAWLLDTINEGHTCMAEQLPVPEEFNPGETVQQHRVPGGTLYCSLGSFTCPEDCPEPDGYCQVTEQPRPLPLCRILEQTTCTGYHSLVLPSKLLTPGVGGYLYGDLLALRAVLAMAGGNYLLSTACTCHGVTDAISITDRKGGMRLE